MAGRKLMTPLVYYGGKSKLAEDVISCIPPHSTWVDVFGGGAAVTLSKKPSEKEYYNDIGFVYTFFKVLRERGEELYDKLILTPWSRKEFEHCLKWREEDDELEKARMWFTNINQGFTHEESCTSWLINKGANSSQAFANRIDMLPQVIARFRRIVIECRSFEELIPLYDNKNVVFYCDPPYIAESRVADGGGYEHEMSWEEHDHLLWMLNRADAQAVVSGYPSPLYDYYLKDWKLKTVVRPSAIHNGKALDNGERFECIWTKEHQQGLWSAPATGKKETRKHTDVPSIRSEDDSSFRQETLFS